MKPETPEELAALTIPQQPFPDSLVGLHDLSIADYHAAPGISRSGLWTIYSRTPAHFRFTPCKEKTEFDVGQAVHDAILSPDIFDEKAFRGPIDRRGNKWTNAVEHCQHHGLICLTEGDYDAVLRMRDAALAHPVIRQALDGAVKERSAFAVDDKTGVLCRCRPDIYSPNLLMGLDIKSCHSASPGAVYYAVRDHGLYMQEPFYKDIWEAAGGGTMEAFAFIFVEKEPPHLAALYELDPDTVAEGRAAYQKALDVYAECERSNQWPGYPATVTETGLRKWDYREYKAEGF